MHELTVSHEEAVKLRLHMREWQAAQQRVDDTGPQQVAAVEESVFVALYGVASTVIRSSTLDAG